MLRKEERMARVLVLYGESNETNGGLLQDKNYYINGKVYIEKTLLI